MNYVFIYVSFSMAFLLLVQFRHLKCCELVHIIIISLLISSNFLIMSICSQSIIKHAEIKNGLKLQKSNPFNLNISKGMHVFYKQSSKLTRKHVGVWNLSSIERKAFNSLHKTVMFVVHKLISKIKYFTIYCNFLERSRYILSVVWQHCTFIFLSLGKTINLL